MVKIIFVSPTYPPEKCFVWSAQHPHTTPSEVDTNHLSFGKAVLRCQFMFSGWDWDSCCFSTRVPAPWNQGPYLIHCCSSTGLPEWSGGHAPLWILCTEQGVSEDWKLRVHLQAIEGALTIQGKENTLFTQKRHLLTKHPAAPTLRQHLFPNCLPRGVPFFLFMQRHGVGQFCGSQVYKCLCSWL